MTAPGRDRRARGAAWLRAPLVGALIHAFSVTAGALERVEVPSLDRRTGAPLQQTALWFRASGEDGPAPAVVLLHGCGGPYQRAGDTSELSVRMREYTRRFNAWGVHVLVTDSLTPRGERELCTQRIGARKVTSRERRLDALGALQWLAARSDVDPQRLGLVGWSHGGSAVLSATHGDHPDVRNSPVRAAMAVAFYPGCNPWSRPGAYTPVSPLTLMIGAADDWTPAEPCHALAQHVAQRGLVPGVTLHVYEGAYHGFDGRESVRLRRDVPNGTRPGEGVHAGGQPAAREASLHTLEQTVRSLLLAGR